MPGCDYFQAVEESNKFTLTNANNFHCITSTTHCMVREDTFLHSALRRDTILQFTLRHCQINNDIIYSIWVSRANVWPKQIPLFADVLVTYKHNDEWVTILPTANLPTCQRVGASRHPLNFTAVVFSLMMVPALTGLISNALCKRIIRILCHPAIAVGFASFSVGLRPSNVMRI